MALVAFLESDGPDRKSVVPSGVCWMYFYSERAQPGLAAGLADLTIAGVLVADSPAMEVKSESQAHLSLTTIVQPADRSRAAEHFEKLSVDQAGLTMDDLVVVVAHCREWIEALCVNMWLGGPYTRSQLQLLSRSALKRAPPPVPRKPGQEALSDWSVQEVKFRLESICEELGLVEEC